ncbi:MAG: hypothetical protein QM731_03475 [Chitinophagaceae bacterium]
MYASLLFFHSLFRWLLLLSLLYAIYRGLRGWIRRLPFVVPDNRARHFTATIAHIQLVLGYTLYFNSPLIKYFRSNYTRAMQQGDAMFFGMIHILVMTAAIIVITIGSASAKRKKTDAAKFKTMTCWYMAALFLIFIAIPWPFSPFANRPYFRNF